LIIGAGGLGRESAWLVRRINEQCRQWNVLGFLDDNAQNKGKYIDDIPVLGGCEAVVDYPDAYVVCAIAATKIRKRLINRIETVHPTVKYAGIIDPSAVISDDVQIGEGVWIGPNTVVTVGVKIGNHVIIDYGCTVGHDTVLEDYTTVYPGANIAGSVNLGNGCEIGTGAKVIQGKAIGASSIIGAGAVVIRDIPANCTAVGCPAGPIKKHSSE